MLLCAAVRTQCACWDLSLSLSLSVISPSQEEQFRRRWLVDWLVDRVTFRVVLRFEEFVHVEREGRRDEGFLPRSGFHLVA